MFKNKVLFTTCSLFFVIFAVGVGSSFFMRAKDGKGIRQIQEHSMFDRIDNQVQGFLVLTRSKSRHGQNQSNLQRTTPAKVEQVLRKNEDTVTVQAVKYFKGNTVFIGRIVPKGYKESEKCVLVRFAIIVITHKRYLSGARFSRFLGLTENQTSGEGVGNVITTYSHQLCKNPTDHLEEIRYTELSRIQKQIHDLMPGLPDGV